MSDFQGQSQKTLPFLLFSIHIYISHHQLPHQMTIEVLPVLSKPFLEGNYLLKSNF